MFLKNMKLMHNGRMPKEPPFISLRITLNGIESTYLAIEIHSVSIFNSLSFNNLTSQ